MKATIALDESIIRQVVPGQAGLQHEEQLSPIPLTDRELCELVDSSSVVKRLDPRASPLCPSALPSLPQTDSGLLSTSSPSPSPSPAAPTTRPSFPSRTASTAPDGLSRSFQKSMRTACGPSRLGESEHLSVDHDQQAQAALGSGAAEPREDLVAHTPNDASLPQLTVHSAACSSSRAVPSPIERVDELDAGLDVCIMTVHGTYLQCPAAGELRVSCLDRFTSFSLLDSAQSDELGQPFKYLRSETGGFLTADREGHVYLDDLSSPDQLGRLRAVHRWRIKKGACQSLVSCFHTFLTISEEGDLLLTATRYEESCLHICFAVTQGSLRKKSEKGVKGLRPWTSKWFVLSGSTLTDFEHERDIYLRAPSSACVSSTAGILSINVHPSPSCRFDVEFVNGRVLQVKAASRAERERWVAALRNGKVSKAMDQKAKTIHKKRKERERRPLRVQVAGDSSSAAPRSLAELHDESALHITVTVTANVERASSSSTASATPASSSAPPCPPLPDRSFNPGRPSTPSLSATPALSVYCGSRPQSPDELHSRSPQPSHATSSGPSSPTSSRGSGTPFHRPFEAPTEHSAQPGRITRGMGTIRRRSLSAGC